MEENNVVVLDNGVDFPVEPTYGGELMPVNQANGQPSKAEMAASVAVVGGSCILVWELGKLFWKKVMIPGYIKAVEKIDQWSVEKDERIARKKAARKNKNKDVVEGNFTSAKNENGVEEPEETQDEQGIPKKGMKAVNGLRRKNRR